MLGKSFWYQIGNHISCQAPIFKAIFQRRFFPLQLLFSGFRREVVHIFEFMKTCKKIVLYIAHKSKQDRKITHIQINGISYFLVDFLNRYTSIQVFHILQNRILHCDKILTINHLHYVYLVIYSLVMWTYLI